jgi:hypothetical protein
MAFEPHWDDDPESYDSIRFAASNGQAVTLGGIVKEIKVSRKTKLDKKVSAGVSGATITFQGYELAEVEITMKIWTRKQWERAQTAIKDLLPDAKKKKPTPRDFFHPMLSLHGLKSLYVEEIEGPGPPGVEGIIEYTVKCVEFAPPPKTTQTNTATASLALQGVRNEVAQAAGQSTVYTIPEIVIPVPSATKPKP